MGFTSFPVEIIEKIFEYLTVAEIRKCCEVCLLWRNVAENVSENVFRKQCQKEYPEDYAKAYAKSSLTWARLYESLELWSQVSSAQIKAYEFKEKEYPRAMWDSWELKYNFEVMQNGVISIPRFIGKEPHCWDMNANSLVYYDSASLKMIKTVNFDDIEFDWYTENEDIIVLRTTSYPKYKYHVIIKKNQKDFAVGEDIELEEQFKFLNVVGNSAYFSTFSWEYPNNMHTIWVAKCIEKQGEFVIETSCVQAIESKVLAVSEVGPNHINILQRFKGAGPIKVYSLIDSKLTCVWAARNKCDDSNNIIKHLKVYGFEWSQQKLFDSISRQYPVDRNGIQITQLKRPIIFKQGNVFIIGICTRALHIYYNPYQNGILKLANKKPTLRIDLNDFFRVYKNRDSYDDYYYVGSRNIDKIDVIEIVNGHRILIAFCHRLVVVELIHNRTVCKRSLSISSSSTN